MTLTKSKQSQRTTRTSRQRESTTKSTAHTTNDIDNAAEANTKAINATDAPIQASAQRIDTGRTQATVKRGGDLASTSAEPRRTQQAAPPGCIIAAPPAAGFSMAPPRDSSLTLTRIIEEYGEHTDLLRLVLAAKTEEDRARTEYERRIQEELRLESRRIDFEMMLHENMFKQQEHQKQQQQLMPPPSHLPQSIHRNDVVLQSPIGPVTHSHHPHPLPTPGHMVPQGSYGMQVPMKQESGNTRSYHHPDTPGGLDARAAQNPFAFFKMPLGDNVYHPSAYHTYGEKSSNGTHPPPQKPPHSHSSSVGHAGSTSSSGNGASLSSSSHSAVAHGKPGGARESDSLAASELSVRIVESDPKSAHAPRSAPVDGPELKKRKVSHDEVIMALRRKVMNKGTQWQQQQQQLSQPAGRSTAVGRAGSTSSTRGIPAQQQLHPQQHRHMAEGSSHMRRSSLAVLTSIDSAELTTPSDDSSSSSSSTPLSASNATAQSTDVVAEPTAADSCESRSSKMRVPSISMIVEPSQSGTLLVGDDADDSSNR
ncbi:hypothetical protein H4R24_000879 [Coemansia sp. RSA 988]|nr:hypothetical protein H4R24_000879 [Coemansia sp. RSA 988]